MQSIILEFFYWTALILMAPGILAFSEFWPQSDCINPGSSSLRCCLRQPMGVAYGASGRCIKTVKSIAIIHNNRSL